MESNGLEIRVQKAPHFFGTQMVFFERGFDNKIVTVGELIMKERKEGVMIPPGSRLEIGDTAIQILMDDLWQCGFRPTEGTGSAGSLRATEKHLEDMRDIAKKSVDLLIEHAKTPKIIEGVKDL